MTARLRGVPLELGAIFGPVILTAAWFVLGFVSPGYALWGTRVAPYSPVSQPISGLGLGPTGPYMNAAFIVAGLLMVAGAAGIFRRIGQLSDGQRWVFAGLVALPGLGSVVDGIFTFQSFFMHFVGFALALTAAVTFPIVGFFVRRVPAWRTLGTGLLFAGPVTAALTVLYFATFTPTVEGIQTGIAGLTERLLILELQAWYVAMGWLAFSNRDQVNRKPAQAPAPDAREHGANEFQQGRDSMTRLRNHPTAALGVLVLGLFMTLLDLTIVNIAIPSILDGLHASLDQVLWVLNAYSLFYAVLLITSARLGDIYGPRNLFAAGVVIFTIASGFSALAQDPTQLIVSRGLQGLGAAVLAPQGLPLMMSLFPVDKRGGVFAIYGVIAGLAVIAGPTVGGLLVTHFGWRSIFTVNLPIGVITFAAAMLLVPDLRPGRKHRLDLAGVAIATGGLLCVIFGLIEGQRYDWGTVASFVTIPEIVGTGVVLLIAFLVYQARRQNKEPLLPFAVFRDRNFTLMTFVMAAMGFAILGLYLPLTIYLQSVLGLSAIDAGLTIALQPVAMIVSSGVASSLVQKINGKYLLIPGLLMLAAGSGYIDWAAHANSGRWDFAAGLILSGLGMGCIWTPVFSIATRDLPTHLAGVASGVINTIQELGGVLASAIVGAFLQNRLALALHDQAVSASAQLPEAYRAPFVNGFSNAAHTGFEVGAGQTGASVSLPPQVEAIAHYVFTHAFVDAMHPTLVLPIVVLVLAAGATWFVRGQRKAALVLQDQEQAVA